MATDPHGQTQTAFQGIIPSSLLRSDGGYHSLILRGLPRGDSFKTEKDHFEEIVNEQKSKEKKEKKKKKST